MSAFAPRQVLVCLVLLLSLPAPAWSYEPYDPVVPVAPPAPTIGTALTHLRTSYTATRLTDGRILLVGGLDSDYAIARWVEVFDPVTGAVTEAAPMPEGRVYHSA